MKKSINKNNIKKNLKNLLMEVGVPTNENLLNTIYERLIFYHSNEGIDILRNKSDSTLLEDDLSVLSIINPFVEVMHVCY